MAKKTYQIPFTQNGHLLSYVNYDNSYYNYKTHLDEAVVWEHNSIFKDTVEYVGYEVGRSACRILLKSTITNRQYSVLIDDFDRLMKEVGLVDNKLTAEFTFAKRGANYMMVPILPDVSP